MKYFGPFAVGLVLVAVVACAPADRTQAVEGMFPELRGDYMGQALPGSQSEIFAPGIVSTGLETRDMAMTPDGNEMFFSVFVNGKAMIMMARRTDGAWSEPVVAPFSGEFMDLEPCISPDGTKFFFISTRPQEGQEPKSGWVYQDIWVMDRKGQGWGPPRNLGPPVNTDAPEYFPSITSDGTIYFTREGQDRVSKTYRSRPIDGGFAEPEVLPQQVNLGTNRFNAFVAPDESFVIVPAVGGPGSLGGVDYYVVHRNDDDTWQEPVNLGPTINNSSGKEWSASLSPDGEYLFFMSSRLVEGDAGAQAGTTLGELVARGSQPGHGSPCIWWVEVEGALGL
ncbi:MAG: hypothetical protein DRJ65_13800 [Acidobacteria bacterium]|nr:MAG: hypothetical protein DRJ65_13800 [Acidobacteriota bacterium]